MPPFGLTAFQLTLPGWMVSSNCLFIQYLLLLLASLAFVIKLIDMYKKKNIYIYIYIYIYILLLWGVSNPGYVVYTIYGRKSSIYCACA